MIHICQGLNCHGVGGFNPFTCYRDPQFIFSNTPWGDGKPPFLLYLKLSSRRGHLAGTSKMQEILSVVTLPALTISGIGLESFGPCWWPHPQFIFHSSNLRIYSHLLFFTHLHKYYNINHNETSFHLDVSISITDLRQKKFINFIKKNINFFWRRSVTELKTST